MDLYGVTPYLERARALIANGNEASIRYAALELRYALETVAFRQLEEYGDEFPGKLVGEWKADQILRVLASFDPVSNTAGELSIAPVAPEGETPTDWTVIGSTQSIGWKDFRRYYNKLGSYLHLPIFKADGVQAKQSISGGSLCKIVDSLEELTKATMILALKVIISGKCKCGHTVYVGQTEFDDGDIVVCGNRKCNAVYQKVGADDGSQILERIQTLSFPCQNCEGKVSILPDEILAIARCTQCSTTYRMNIPFITLKPEAPPAASGNSLP